MTVPAVAPTARPDRHRGAGRWLNRHQGLLDVCLALLLTAGSLLGLFVLSDPEFARRSPDAIGAMLAIGTALPLVIRRGRPLAVTTLVGACYLASGIAGYPQNFSDITLMVAIYTLGAHARVLPGLIVCCSLTAASLGVLLLLRDPAGPPGTADILITTTFGILIFIGPWVVGRAIGARRVYLDELEAHAARLERAHAAEVRAALAEERSRVARELHDVVAHHVSVMTVQATAARRTLDRAPEKSLEAMRAVEETGRAALTEMRRIVGALRSHDADETDLASVTERGVPERPQAGVTQLGELLTRAREAGIDVGFTVIGAPTSLPSGVDLAVYRVVQEALTNTLRHAAATRADVRLEYLDSIVVITVIDNGRSGSRAEPAGGAIGHGLIGMRERIALNGGTLITGPRPGNGFLVKARLPSKEIDTP